MKHDITEKEARYSGAKGATKSGGMAQQEEVHNVDAEKAQLGKEHKDDTGGQGK